MILKAHKFEAARTFLEENYKQANATVDKIIKEEEEKRAKKKLRNKQGNKLKKQGHQHQELLY